MARRPISIRVNPKDRKRIERLVRAGVQQVRVVVRALALRQLAEGATAPRVAEALPLTAKAIRQIAHRYKSAGLDRAAIQQWARQAHKEFYLRPAYVWQRARHTRSLSDLKVNVQGLFMLLDGKDPRPAI